MNFTRMHTCDRQVQQLLLPDSAPIYDCPQFAQRLSTTKTGKINRKVFVYGPSAEIFFA